MAGRTPLQPDDPQKRDNYLLSILDINLILPLLNAMLTLYLLSKHEED